MASLESEEGQEYLSTSEKIKYFQKLLKTQAEEASRLPEDRNQSGRFQQVTPQRIDFSWRDAVKGPAGYEVAGFGGHSDIAPEAAPSVAPCVAMSNEIPQEEVPSGAVAETMDSTTSATVSASAASATSGATGSDGQVRLPETAVRKADRCVEASPSTRASSSDAGYVADLQGKAAASPSADTPRAEIAARAREAMQKRREGTPTSGSRKQGDPRRNELAAKAYQRYHDVWQMT